MDKVRLAEAEGTLEIFLAAAQHMVTLGKLEQAERIYKQALRLAEKDKGENSALCGIVLVDLMKFYEQNYRHEEAEALWERVRGVVIEYLASNPELLETDWR